MPPPDTLQDNQIDPDWKRHATLTPHGYYTLATDDTRGVPVRLFFTPSLLAEAETTLYRQIVNATRFAGTKLVVITPDAHFGYGVPVGCVIVTDRANGAVAMGPVGFDIGCGMISARSTVSFDRATADRKLAFNREVMSHVPMGTSTAGAILSDVTDTTFEDLVRGGAEAYFNLFPTSSSPLSRARTERDRIPVDDRWAIPWGGDGRPERGRTQLGSLGGGNHFIELQHDQTTDTLFVQIHTGSRGFGHGLATHYFSLARADNPDTVTDIDLGAFTPESPHYDSYLNAVAAGGNFAIVNRLLIFEAVSRAFRKVFKSDLELVYEISHNLVQAEHHSDYGDVWVHRKGATRAFPAEHPSLANTPWAATGHPVLIPGSNRDYSYILRPSVGASRSAYSVNHGAGRRLSRGEALRRLDQRTVNEQYRHAHVLVNLDGDVPLDESAACYKRSDEVINAVVTAGLATVEHTLWPLASLKGTDTPERHRSNEKSRKTRDGLRREARNLKHRG